MTNITAHISAAKDIIANAKTGSGLFQTGDTGEGSSRINTLLAERARIEEQLSRTLPDNIRESLEARFIAINTELQTAIEADLQANWETMTNAEKQEVLQDVYTTVAAELGISPTALRFIPFGEGNAIHSGLIGLESSDGYIYIDINDLDMEFSSLTNIVAHETYHQYQDAMIAIYNDPDASLPPGVDEATVEEWIENQANYTSYGNTGYRTQPVESSAYDYGDGYEERYYENYIDDYTPPEIPEGVE